MTARAAQLPEELATVTATSAERERALQAEVAELRRDLDTIIRERDTSFNVYSGNFPAKGSSFIFFNNNLG